MLSSVADAAYEQMDWLCGRPVYPRETSGPFSVRPDASQPVWTHADVGAGPLVATPFPGCDTVYATFKYAVQKNGKRPAVGQRTLIKVRPGPQRALGSRGVLHAPAAPRPAARRAEARQSATRAARPPARRRCACASVLRRECSRGGVGLRLGRRCVPPPRRCALRAGAAAAWLRRGASAAVAALGLRARALRHVALLSPRRPQTEHVKDPKDASKSVEKLHLGDYAFITYDEMAARVVRPSRGLPSAPRLP